MRIFKSNFFHKFAQKEQISDNLLCQVVENVQQGLIDADLGGGVLKQRIPRQGQGKSGGYRSIIFYKTERFCVFAYCYAKSTRSNITQSELQGFKESAKELFELTDSQIQQFIQRKMLIEIERKDHD